MYNTSRCVLFEDSLFLLVCRPLMVCPAMSALLSSTPPPMSLNKQLKTLCVWVRLCHCRFVSLFARLAGFQLDVMRD